MNLATAINGFELWMSCSDLSPNTQRIYKTTAAIQFLRNGGNIFVLQRMLGHRSLTMVKRYLQLSDQDTQAAMQAFSPADRWHVRGVRFPWSVLCG